MFYDSLDPVDDSFIKDYENFQSKTCELDRKLGAVLGKYLTTFLSLKISPVKFVLPKLSRKIVVKNLVLDLNSTFVNYVIKHLGVLSCNSFVGYEPPKFVPMVFCYHNCSNVLWEKIEKKVCKFEAVRPRICNFFEILFSSHQNNFFHS